MTFRLLTMLFTFVLISGPVLADQAKSVTPTPSEVASLGADQYLSQKVTRVLGQLGDGDLDAAQREQRFRTLVMEIFDAPFISRFVLGAHWDKISVDEQARFTTSLIELQVQRWAQRFKPSMQASALTVGTPQVNDRGHYIVPMSLAGSESLQVLWVMHRQGDAFKVFDVIVAGTSVLMTYRDEYQSFIRQNGSVTKLTDQLEQQVARATSAR